MDAKTYENVGMRTHIQNTPEHLDLLTKDSVNNIQKELDKEGHTGKLSEPDGLDHKLPQMYRGFLIELFGAKRYQSELDVIGSWKFVGCAYGKVLDKGRATEVVIDTTISVPRGFETLKECGHYLFTLIDAIRDV